MDIETAVFGVVGIFAVLITILAFGILYGGEWSAVAGDIAPLTIAFIAFGFVIAGIAYWRR